MPFKSKAQARAAFAGYIPGIKGKKAKEWTDKTNFSNIPDHVKEELELGTAKVKPEETDGLKSPSPEVFTGNKPAHNPEVVQAKKVNEEINLGVAKKSPEATDGLPSHKPEATDGLKSPTPEVIQAKKGKTTTQAAPALTTAQKTQGEKGKLQEELNTGVQTSDKPAETDGLPSPTPEVLTGNKPVKHDEVIQATDKLSEELEKGEAHVSPEQTDGLPSAEPETTTGLPSDGHPQVVQAQEMDEASAAKHAALSEKAAALKAQMEELEKEMTSVKEMGVKKHLHNTKKDEVNKLGEEIKALKEKTKEPIAAPHDRTDNKHIPKSTRTIPSKKAKEKHNKKNWKKEFKHMDESVQILKESFTNAYIRKMSRTNMISERVLLEYWEKAIKLQEQKGQYTNKSDRKFWNGVVSKFNAIMNEQELAKAKSIMTEREKFQVNTTKFMDCLATNNYLKASTYLDEMVSSKLATLIDQQKVQYQKEIGQKITKKIREI